jgi:hypothetical protein
VYINGFIKGKVKVSRFVLYKCSVGHGALLEDRSPINTASVHQELTTLVVQYNIGMV